jgi:hypothetical protein
LRCEEALEGLHNPLAHGASRGKKEPPNGCKPSDWMNKNNKMIKMATFRMTCGHSGARWRGRRDCQAEGVHATKDYLTKRTQTRLKTKDLSRNEPKRTQTLHPRHAELIDFMEDTANYGATLECYRKQVRYNGVWVRFMHFVGFSVTCGHLLGASIPRRRESSGHQFHCIANRSWTGCTALPSNRWQ